MPNFIHAKNHKKLIKTVNLGGFSHNFGFLGSSSLGNPKTSKTNDDMIVLFGHVTLKKIFLMTLMTYVTKKDNHVIVVF